MITGMKEITIRYAYLTQNLENNLSVREVLVQLNQSPFDLQVDNFLAVSKMVIISS